MTSDNFWPPYLLSNLSDVFPHNVRYLGVILDPLPPLKSDVINWVSPRVMLKKFTDIILTVLMWFETMKIFQTKFMKEHVWCITVQIFWEGHKNLIKKNTIMLLSEFKTIGRLFQICVAFSEYMNFKPPITWNKHLTILHFYHTWITKVSNFMYRPLEGWELAR